MAGRTVTVTLTEEDLYDLKESLTLAATHSADMEQKHRLECNYSYPVMREVQKHRMAFEMYERIKRGSAAMLSRLDDWKGRL